MENENKIKASNLLSPQEEGEDTGQLMTGFGPPREPICVNCQKNYGEHAGDMCMTYTVGKGYKPWGEGKTWTLAAPKVADSKPDAIRELVDQQAADEGLWFKAKTAPEAYLQRELRRLHAAIEAKVVDSKEEQEL